MEKLVVPAGRQIAFGHSRTIRPLCSARIPSHHSPRRVPPRCEPLLRRRPTDEHKTVLLGGLRSPSFSRTTSAPVGGRSQSARREEPSQAPLAGASGSCAPWRSQNRTALSPVASPGGVGRGVSVDPRNLTNDANSPGSPTLTRSAGPGLGIARGEETGVFCF